MIDSNGTNPEQFDIWPWFRKGLAGVVSAPAFILMASFIGFGAFARDAGFGLTEAAAMTGLVWALPSQMVYVGSLAAGLSFGAAALAVSLSAVRLLPMTASLIPILRDETTPRWKLMLLSHFVAITAWVISMRHLPDMPRPARIPFFVGFAASLTVCNIVVTIIGYSLAGAVPPLLAAGLFFLTPIYFLLALWAAARVRTDHFALGFGLVLGPVMNRIDPDFDIVWAGLLGGTLAFLVSQMLSRLGWMKT